MMRTTRLITDPTELGRRTWMLLLMDAIDRSGLAPMASSEIHQLAFYANGLTPVYEMELRGPELLRLKRGPFYPGVQWDLDRLVGTGLLRLGTIDYQWEAGETWLLASYRLSEPGRQSSARALHAPRAVRTLHFLMEVVDAFARMGLREAREAAIWNDATYGDPELVERALIDLADPEQNATLWTADLFGSYANSRIPLKPREKLHLYFRYLQRLTGGING